MKKICLSGKYAIGKNKFALVDGEEYECLSQYKWKAKLNSTGMKIYAVCNSRINGKSVTLRMHREVMKVKQGEQCDVFHLNNNSLDNRKCNLKKGTRKDTVANIKNVMVNHKCSFCGIKIKKYVKKVLLNE